jgi:hypothetical protein
MSSPGPGLFGGERKIDEVECTMKRILIKIVSSLEIGTEELE